MGENGNSDILYFLDSKITADSDCTHEIKMHASWKKSYDKPRKHIRKQRHHFLDKGPSSQSYCFSSTHVWMWDLDLRAPKNWCFQTVLEKTLESPLDCKEIKTANPKRNQPWAFTGRTDAEAEAQAPVLWSSDVKSRLTAKDPDAGKDWRQGKGGVAGDECTYIQWSITQP